MFEQATIFVTQWGDLASVTGLLVSGVGFAVTIWAALGATSAAQAAEDASNSVRATLSAYNLGEDVERLHTLILEAKALHHRANADVEFLLDRYSRLRCETLRVRSLVGGYGQEYSEKLLRMARDLSKMEENIQRLRVNEKDHAARLVAYTQTLNRHAEVLNELAARCREELTI